MNSKLFLRFEELSKSISISNSLFVSSNLIMLFATLVISSTIVIEAICADLDRGFRSTTITVFPIATSASQRSPSSRGTNMTSLSMMPFLQHFALGPLRPGINESGVLPNSSTCSECLAFNSLRCSENNVYPLFGSVKNVYLYRTIENFSNFH